MMKVLLAILSFVFVLSGCSLGISKDLEFEDLSELLEEDAVGQVVEVKPEVVKKNEEIVDDWEDDSVVDENDIYKYASRMGPDKPNCPDRQDYWFTVEDLYETTNWSFREFKRGDVVLNPQDMDEFLYLTFILADSENDDYRIENLDNPFSANENKIIFNQQVGRYFIDGSNMKITDLDPSLETGLAKELVENLLKVERFRFFEGFICGYLALEFPNGELKLKATQ